MIETYVYSSCTSCRKTDDYLSSAGVDFVSRDFFKERFSKEELRALLDRAGLAPADVLSKRSRAYKRLGLDEKAPGPDELLDLMAAEPTLLRRPIVIGGGEIIVGHNARGLADLVAKTAT